MLVNHFPEGFTAQTCMRALLATSTQLFRQQDTLRLQVFRVV